MAATDHNVFPVKNVAYRHPVHFRKNDGTLITSWTSPSAIIVKDGGASAPSTNAPVESPAGSGLGYIDLTASEMNAEMVQFVADVTNADALEFVGVVSTGGLAEIVAAVPTAAQIATAVAAAILATPANLLETNADGQVECSNLDEVAIPSAASVASAVWSTAKGAAPVGRAATRGEAVDQLWGRQFNLVIDTGSALNMYNDSAVDSTGTITLTMAVGRDPVGSGLTSVVKGRGS